MNPTSSPDGSPDGRPDSGPDGDATAAADLGAWRRLAPGGLLLVGAGASVALDASSRRASGSPVLRWVAQGTAGLVLLNAGLCLFGEAVKRRALYDAATRP